MVGEVLDVSKSELNNEQAIRREEQKAPPILKTTEPVASKRIPSKYSINAVLEHSGVKEEEVHEVLNAKLPSSHFTETDLQTEWTKFLNDLKTSNPFFYNAISLFKLQKKGEDVIEVTFPSDSAKSEFEKVRGDFINHFMHKINHFNLVIEYRKDVSLKSEIVTKRMVFDKFASINPVLRELDDLFKFDFNS